MRTAAAIVLAAAACGGRAAPRPIDNRGPATASTPACPADPPPFAVPAPVADAADCVHGAATAMLTAPAGPPTCHQFRATGPTSAVEAITVADGRRLWIAQGGCVHATIEIHGPAGAVIAARDRPAAAAELLRALAAYDQPDGWFTHIADDVAAAAPPADGGGVPIGAGDWTAAIDAAADGALTVTLDFPL